MKTLVVYHSLSGNTKFIAENIAKPIGADIAEIKPVVDYNPIGFSKYFWGGKQVIMKETPSIQSLTVDLQSYDLIVIGTPVWINTFSPPVRTFLSQTKLINKKIALFCIHDNGPGEAIKNLETALAGNQVVGYEAFKSPLSYPEDSKQKAINWARLLLR